MRISEIEERVPLDSIVTSDIEDIDHGNAGTVSWAGSRERGSSDTEGGVGVSNVVINRSIENMADWPG